MEERPATTTKKERDCKRGPVRVLVIAETLPRADERSDLRELLRSLLSRRYAVTFVAREGLGRSGDESALRQLGIATFADDQERLVVMGKTMSGNASWSFDRILSETQFDLAILTHSFGRGLSIPEQYLDDLRRKSPATRIVLWAREIHEALPLPTRNDRKDIEAFEKSQDWRSRQEEAFARADLVVIDIPGHPLSLPTGKEIGSLNATRSENLLDAVAQALERTPKPGAEDPFSIMQVEILFRGRLESRHGLKRLLGQLECYATFADLLLKEGKVAEAREQLRHIFGRLDRSFEVTEFVTHITVLLRRCYNALGDSAPAYLYAETAREIAMGKWAREPLGRPIRHSADAPLISLIVPTYNRLPILRKCLAALEAQTQPKSDFEVIVIDDGSDDGSEGFLRDYHPEFRFQYLRQRNSGTGAARRNGVAHASGDYLLLMNDDSICDPDVVEQHLSVHRKFSTQRWAVLGSFEYPAEARRRALTHYFCVEPFMFPQVSMEEGCPYTYSHFITCNLSVRRDAVMGVGSFASIYKLSEDTEMGLRLCEEGFRVLYHPKAHAWHDHLPYPARNLIRRARVYGTDYFHMFRRHPRVMKEWGMPVPLTAMDEANATRILDYVEANRKDVEQAVEALERWDEVDFEVLLEQKPETASMVTSLFRQAVPAIHWFYLYETMFQTMVRELNLVHLAPIQPQGLRANAASSS